MGIILGVTGTLSSGKDEFSRYLRKKGFTHISLADLLKEELVNRNVEFSRDSLRSVGNELRENRGLGVLAQMALDLMNPDGDYVVTSIRNPDEIKVFRTVPNFFLVELDAPVKVRFERALLRNREEEKRSLVEFIENEEKELSSDNPASQQLSACMKLADHKIINDDDMNAFHAKIDALLAALR